MFELPISKTRRICSVITVTLFYFLYTHSQRVRDFISAYVPYSLLSSFSRVSIPTLKSPTLPSFPSLKSPRHVFRTRSRRFRPHETRLRAWATEDGILDDGYERGLLADIDGGEDVGYNLGSEEDFMVNSASARSGGTSRRAPGDALFGAGATQEDVDTDEEMPLAPSPRKFSGSKGTVKTYGSAG